MTMFADAVQQAGPDQLKNAAAGKNNEPDILDMFTLLNMALSTVEYEGCEDLLESDGGGGGENDDQVRAVKGREPSQYNTPFIYSLCYCLFSCSFGTKNFYSPRAQKTSSLL